jgi:EpsI family protein
VLPSLARNANFDDWMSRVYAGADGEVELLLGYFELQQPGKELGGWGLSQMIPSESMAVASDMARVRDGLTRVNGTTYHLTYWYLIDGRVATAGYEAKLWTTFNAITAGRSNGGVIVVSRALGANESIDTSRSKVNAFINDVMRASAIYFPQG